MLRLGAPAEKREWLCSAGLATAMKEGRGRTKQVDKGEKRREAMAEERRGSLPRRGRIMVAGNAAGSVRHSQHQEHTP